MVETDEILVNLHLFDILSSDHCDDSLGGPGGSLRMLMELVYRVVQDGMSVLDVATAVLGTTAFAAWLVAAVSGLQMIRHARPGVSTTYLLTHGIAFFSGDKFTPAAAPYRRRLQIAAATFFAIIIIAIIVSLSIQGVELGNRPA